MVCECNNNINNDDSTIQFIAGTSFTLTVNFTEDISSYPNAIFAIRADYATAPVIQKTISVTEANSLDITLSPSETALFTDFKNGKNSAAYIWGLDLADSDNNIQVNVFPQTGNPAPLCIVYKHVIEE